MSKQIHNFINQLYSFVVTKEQQLLCDNDVIQLKEQMNNIHGSLAFRMVSGLLPERSQLSNGWTGETSLFGRVLQALPVVGGYWKSREDLQRCGLEARNLREQLETLRMDINSIGQILSKFIMGTEGGTPSSLNMGIACASVGLSVILGGLLARKFFFAKKEEEQRGEDSEFQTEAEIGARCIKLQSNENRKTEIYESTAQGLFVSQQNTDLEENHRSVDSLCKSKKGEEILDTEVLQQKHEAEEAAEVKDLEGRSSTREQIQSPKEQLQQTDKVIELLDQAQVYAGNIEKKLDNLLLEKGSKDEEVTKDQLEILKLETILQEKSKLLEEAQLTIDHFTKQENLVADREKIMREEHAAEVTELKGKISKLQEGVFDLEAELEEKDSLTIHHQEIEAAMNNQIAELALQANGLLEALKGKNEVIDSLEKQRVLLHEKVTAAEAQNVESKGNLEILMSVNETLQQDNATLTKRYNEDLANKQTEINELVRVVTEKNKQSVIDQQIINKLKKHVHSACMEIRVRSGQRRQVIKEFEALKNSDLVYYIDVGKAIQSSHKDNDEIELLRNKIKERDAQYQEKMKELHHKIVFYHTKVTSLQAENIRLKEDLWYIKFQQETNKQKDKIEVQNDHGGNDKEDEQKQEDTTIVILFQD
ncbi:putative leucine-rich repeat-containing protein DDB_G0290503 [Palaemon carinicauda]|uniref:putative leucine-rich repeat-containing protein DDB_G0290503 n=1 Tax=Palaemon carinicauda TaxID=392227 RepID=UPI0035B6356B